MDGRRTEQLKRLRLAAPIALRGGGGPVHASLPWDECNDLAALAGGVGAVYPGFDDRPTMILAGAFGGNEFTASLGRLVGRSWAPVVSRGRSARLAELHYGRIDRWDGDERAETWILFDVTAPGISMGLWPCAPPLGPPLFPPPALADDGGDAAAGMARVDAMIAGLMRYDGRELASMGMRDHWHPGFRWYGPAAIGAFEGFDDYEAGHAWPFLTAFPDRVGGNHLARIAEGAFVASGGLAFNPRDALGPGLAGLPATGKAITMRVMDFWRVEDDRLVENWVFIDIPHVLAQLGLDPFARLDQLLGRA